MVDERASMPVTVIGHEQAWNQTSDVVVVGTGIAGCSTAFNTLEHGVSVLMLEKGETTGGTSANRGGRDDGSQQPLPAGSRTGGSARGLHPFPGTHRAPAAL